MQSSTVSEPRRRAWQVLVPGGAAMAMALAGDLTLYAVLPAYAAGLGLSLAALGLLLSANRLVRLISNPLVGLLADRFNRRGLVLLGLTAGVLSTLLYTVAAGFWVFLLGRLLWGISWSILYIGLYAMVLDVTGPGERGWSSGMLQTFYFAGLALNPLLGGILSEKLGFTSALLVCAAVQSIGLLGALLFLPNGSKNPARAGQPVTAAPTGQDHAAGGSHRTAWLASWRARAGQFITQARALGTRELISANGLYMLTLFIGDGIIMSTVTLYLKQRYGDLIQVGTGVVPVAAAGGLLIALRAVVSAVGAPTAGKLADRSGARWRVAAGGAVLAVAGCVLLGVDGSIWTVLMGIVLASFGSGMLMAVLPVIVSTAADGQNSALSLGVLITSGDVGCAIAPLVSYALLGALTLSQLYIIAAALLTAGGLAVWLWARAAAAKIAEAKPAAA